MLGARLLVAMLALVGCTRVFEKETVQPNPLVHPTETLRGSERITIVTGDMELNQPVSNGCNSTTSCTATTYSSKHYPLFNVASFTMVSRDRLRFHVQVDHKWEEWADLKSWEVSLVDDQGHQWSPEGVEHARTRLITKMWDYEQRRAICDQRGTDSKGDCITTVGWDEDPGHSKVMHSPLGSLSVYRGNADFVFYQRDLMSTRVRWLKLVVKRSGEAFEFTWRFEDEVASE